MTQIKIETEEQKKNRKKIVMFNLIGSSCNILDYFLIFNVYTSCFLNNNHFKFYQNNFQGNICNYIFFIKEFCKNVEKLFY